ncbi:MAG: UPF0182 family protein [Bifidobacteriaceae bacterium]|jgi:uncharacterized membrane protein (UPF0182 family)|nr:UPF0182 family protein [Bifidobacteriaceae bacterium]
MPPRSPRQSTTVRRSGKPLWRSPIVWTIVILLVVALLLMAGSRFWTEILWFKQVGYLNVFTTQWLARICLFVAGGALMGGLVWFAMWLAYRSRPVYASSAMAGDVAERYRNAFDPLRRAATIVLPIVIGLFAGTNAASNWEKVLLAFNGTSFGQVDPQFGLDVSFYTFTLPAIRFALSFVQSCVALALVAGLVIHYLYGGLRLAQGRGVPRITPAARAQLGISAAIFCLCIAVQYWLDRYSMLTETGDRFDGAGYTMVHATMPAKAIMAFIAVFVAVMFAVAAWRGNWKLPATAVGLMVISGLAVGWAYPALIQRFSVVPTEAIKESPYIQRNITATRTAFGLDDIEVEQYSAKTTAEAGALRQDAESTASIRLLDPTVVTPTFRQKQQNKQYYDFPSVLAVDRYEIDGEKRDTVIAVRDINLSGIGADASTWVNQHTVYTHGYGVVAAYGNTTDEQGWPSFYEGDIPAEGELDVAEPRVYFGTTSPEYSIVGGPEGAEPVELDYPSDEAALGQVNTTYAGDGGPNVGSPLNKLLYAIRFRSTNILFSSNVNPDSQILYDRDPATRVQKVAPYLTLDERVYPAVVDGQIVWIVDGYTTTDYYPYAEHQTMSSATLDSITARSGVAGLTAMSGQSVNYIRNSVKAVVNAYDGSVTLYAWDAEDPVLQAWAGVYNNTLHPVSEISSELMAHLRYPESMFKVQRTVLAKYHVTDASTFYSGQDFWQIPTDPTQTNSNVQQPPYYLTLKMPSQDEATFSLSTSFIPIGTGTNDRPILKGFLAVDSETGDTAGAVAGDYGKLRLLVLPQGSSVAGPSQVQNSFDSDGVVKDALYPFQIQGSTVVKGNLLTLPVGGGLLYVQPVYVQAAQGTAFPSLQKVVVGFGDKVGVADTLNEALDQVFGGDSGAEAGDADVVKDPDVDLGDGTTVPDDGSDSGTSGESTATPSATPSATASATPSQTPSATATATTPAGDMTLDEALDAMGDAIEAADEAMKAGDWEAYGRAQDALQAAWEAVESARQP